jgi:hypothetical protein
MAEPNANNQDELANYKQPTRVRPVNLSATVVQIAELITNGTTRSAASSRLKTSKLARRPRAQP